MIRKHFLQKLLSSTFHFAYAKFKKSLRAAYATFPPPCFRLRMTYASLARPCAHQGFQRLFLMPYAEACAPLTQPFRPRCLSSNFSTELTHSLRGACATLAPFRGKNENAYAMLARCLRDLPPAMFLKCAQRFCLRGNFSSRCRKNRYTLFSNWSYMCIYNIMCVYIYIYIHIHIYTYTYIYIYIHIYIYI